MTTTDHPRAFLTRTEHRTLKIIRDFIGAHGYRPTYAEIAAALGVKAKSQAFRLVRNLECKGALRLNGVHSIVLSNHFTVDLPDDMAGMIRRLADKAGISPEAMIVETLWDGLAAAGLSDVNHETRAA